MRWWITVFDVNECAEWLRWKNFDEATSEETGEEDHVTVLGRGWLGRSRENGKGRDLDGTGIIVHVNDRLFNYFARWLQINSNRNNIKSNAHREYFEVVEPQEGEQVRKVMGTDRYNFKKRTPSPFKLRFHVIDFLTFEFRRHSFVSPTMTTALSLHATLFFVSSLSHPRRLVLHDPINSNDHDHGSGREGKLRRNQPEGCQYNEQEP